MVGGPISSTEAASLCAVGRASDSRVHVRCVIDRRRLSVSPRTAAQLSFGPLAAGPRCCGWMCAEESHRPRMRSIAS